VFESGHITSLRELTQEMSRKTVLDKVEPPLTQSPFWLFLSQAWKVFSRIMDCTFQTLGWYVAPLFALFYFISGGDMELLARLGKLLLERVRQGDA